MSLDYESQPAPIPPPPTTSLETTESPSIPSIPPAPSDFTTSSDGIPPPLSESELSSQLPTSNSEASEPNDSSLPTEDATHTMYDPFNGLSFQVGVAENKNSMYRNKMEDVHTYIANFTERVDWGYFGIFDGHAGKDAARWCGNNLHLLLEQEIDMNQSTNPELPPENPIVNANDMKEDLYRSFIKADELIEKGGQGASGCTAAVAILRWEIDNDSKASESTEQSIPQRKKKYEFVPKPNHKRMLYTSNAGDSRVVLFRSGKAYRLSYDHKATDTNEINRIEQQGGLILKNRVNGVLAVTRSLGDIYMKDLVIGKPFTTSTEITAEDEFIILACDGIWDVISDQKAGQFVSKLFKNGATPKEASQKLCQLAIDNSSTDNITVMIVKFDKEIFL